MKKYNKAPLPFHGQKRNFIKLFNEKIKNLCGDGAGWTIIDVFGGSGLLAHNAKYSSPNARVIYNDYDNYSERLRVINQTELSRKKLLSILELDPVSVINKNKIEPDTKHKILEYLYSLVDVDCETISSWILFSGNISHDLHELEGKTLYNRIPRAPLSGDGYLTGVDVVHKCFTELMSEPIVGNALYLLDPPYINTQQNYKNNYFGFVSQLKLLNLIKPPFMYFTSEKSEIHQLVYDECPYSNVFSGCEIFKQNSIVNNRSSYTDILITKQ